MATTMKQWVVAGTGGFDDLKYDEKAPVPELGENDVLVKCRPKKTYGVPTSSFSH